MVAVVDSGTLLVVVVPVVFVDGSEPNGEYRNKKQLLSVTGGIGE